MSTLHTTPAPGPVPGACLGLTLSAGYLLVTLATLSQFGATWDELIWFPIGDRQLLYLETFDRSYLVEKPGWIHYGPFAAILSSCSASLFHDTLGWLAEDTARHLPNAFFATVAAAAVFFLVAARDGTRRALLAFLFFVTLPRWFGHAHNNMSDMPAAACFMATLAGGVCWARSRRPGWLASAAVAAGLTAAIRPQTAILLPVVASVWLAVDPLLRRRVRERPLAVPAFALVALAVALSVWPRFWGAPLDVGAEVVDFFLHPPPGKGLAPVFYMGHVEFTPAWHYPWVMTLVTTPVAPLALAMLGMAFALRSRTRVSVAMATSWLALTVGSHSFMLRGNYDGVRHFLEAFGALAWLSALGAAWLLEMLERLAGRYDRAGVLGPITIAMLLAPSVVGIVRLHPYPQVYYNALVGGVMGAEQSFDVDYWGFSAREAMRFVNEVAAPGATVAIPWGMEHALFYRRSDLSVVPATTVAEFQALRSQHARAGPSELYFVYFLRTSFAKRHPVMLDQVNRTLPLEFEVQRAGAALARVHRALAPRSPR